MRRRDADAAAAARARRRESEGLADELVYPGGLTTFEDSDEDARAAQRGDAKAPRDNQAALFGVLAALAISLLAVVARIVSDAAAAALEDVAEVRSGLSSRARLYSRSSASASPRRPFINASRHLFLWRARRGRSWRRRSLPWRTRGGCRVICARVPACDRIAQSARAGRSRAPSGALL